MSPHPSFLLRLLALAFALLSTGCPFGQQVSGDTKTDPALTLLSPAEPLYRHRVQLRVGPKKRSDSVEVFEASLSIRLRALKWKQEEGRASTVLPWFRARIFDEADGQLLRELPFVLNGSQGTNPWALGIPSSHYLDVSPSTPRERVERSFVIEFERQGPPSEGTIHVDWELGASGMADGGDPLLVTLTYP